MRCMINFCLYASNWSILILFQHCTSVPRIQRTIHALFKVACFSFTVYSYIFNHRINMGLIGWRILCYTLREPRMAVITWTIFTRLMARCGFLSIFSKLHYFQHSLICLLVYNWGLAPKVIATATNEDLTWAASLEVADIFDVAGLICPSLYYVIYCGK